MMPAIVSNNLNSRSSAAHGGDWMPAARVYYTALMFAGLLGNTLLGLRPVQAQDSAGDASVQNVRNDLAESGADDAIKVTSNKFTLRVIERLTKDLEFNEMLKTVKGFDEKIIFVESLTPKKLRIRGLAQGVTNMLITGASGQKYVIETYVGGDARQLQMILKDTFPGSSIQVRALAEGAILLTGYVIDTQTIQQIMDVANVYSDNVINQIRVGGPQEVQTRVKVLEVQRSKLRTFGINLQALTKSAVISSTPGSITPITSLINPIGGSPSASQQPTSTSPLSLTAGFSGNQFAFDLFIQALKEEGLLKVMSEPVLTARSGEAARISSGGEFPIPVPGGLGTVTIEWREFGVILQTLPLVLSPTRVKMQVTAEVSDKDVANSITLQGTTVPGLTKREIKSTVDMNFGDTMVVGGLISTRETGSALKTSLLGEVPWLGTLFSKKINQQSEIELIILLTPEYGGSLTPDQVPPGGPGSTTTSPIDRELIIDGLMEVPKYGVGCPPNSDYLNGGHYPNHGGYQGNGDPTLPMIQPQPEAVPSADPNSAGLITPSASRSSRTSKSNLTAQSAGSRSKNSGTPRSGTTANPNTRNDDSDSDVLPAGFRKSTKSGSKPTATESKRNELREQSQWDR